MGLAAVCTKPHKTNHCYRGPLWPRSCAPPLAGNAQDEKATRITAMNTHSGGHRTFRPSPRRQGPFLRPLNMGRSHDEPGMTASTMQSRAQKAPVRPLALGGATAAV